MAVVGIMVAPGHDHGAAELRGSRSHGTRGAARSVDPAASRTAAQERQRDDHAAHHQGAHPRTHCVD